jgi:hypothetical protein
MIRDYLNPDIPGIETAVEHPFYRQKHQKSSRKGATRKRAKSDSSLCEERAIEWERNRVPFVV